MDRHFLTIKRKRFRRIYGYLSSLQSEDFGYGTGEIYLIYSIVGMPCAMLVATKLPPRIQ